MLNSTVCCVCFSADGRFLATGCNRSAQIYNVHTGEKMCVLIDNEVPQAGETHLRSICFSPDGRYLVTGGEDWMVRIWDVNEEIILRVFKGHGGEIFCLDFAANGFFVASGSRDNTVRIWQPHDGASKTIFVDAPSDKPVACVAISPDCGILAAGSMDCSCVYWATRTASTASYLLRTASS